MTLTPAQKTTLKNYILNDSILNAFPNNSDGSVEIANRLNLTASPNFTVWRTSISKSEIHSDSSFAWIEIDNLTAGQYRIWEQIFIDGMLNPNQLNVRAGISECWKGTANKVAVATAVLQKCKRNATVFEKIFATGTGSDTSPATIILESPIIYQDVEIARNS